MELDFCGRADYIGFENAQDRDAFVAAKPSVERRNGREVCSDEGGFPTQGAGGQLFQYIGGPHKGLWGAAVLCG